MAQITLKINLDIPGLQAELDKAVVEIKQKLAQFGTVDLKADTKQAKDGVAAVGKEVDGVADKANKTREAFSSWGMIATGIQSTFSAIQQFTAGMSDIVGESVKVASKVEGVEIAFNRLNKPGLLDDLRASTKGTISDLSLMQAAVRADKFKIPLEQLGSLLQFAQRTAQATGQSVDYLVDSIVMGIGRKSPLILDNLGISAIELRKKFGDIPPELATVATVAKAVGEIATEELEKMGEASVVTSDQYSRINTQIEEQRTNIGKLINDGLRPLLDYYDKSSEGQKKFFTSLVAISSMLIPAIPLIVQLYTAKKIFASASLISAAAVTTETAALEANTVAATASLGAVGKLIALLSTIGLVTAGIAAVGVVIYSLNENIKSLDVKKVEDMAKALNQLERDRATKSSLGYDDPLKMTTTYEKSEQQKLIDDYIKSQKGVAEVKKELSKEELEAAKKLADDLAKAKVDALKEGKAKELAELNLWYAIELDKHKNNAEWKLLVDEQYKNKKKMLDDKTALDEFTIESERQKRYIDLEKDSLTKSIALINNEFFLKREKAQGNADEIVLLEKERVDKIAKATADYNKKELDADIVLREKTIQGRAASEEKEIALLNIAMEKELSATGLTEAMKHAIKADYDNRIKELREKNAKESTRIEQERIAELASAYEQHFGAIVSMAQYATTSQRSMASQLRAYLTQQLQQYLVKFIAAKFAEASIHSATETQKTTATGIGVAARIGLMALEIVKELAVAAASIVSAIAKGISYLFATLGPFAIPAIAGMVAATMGAWNGIKKAFGFKDGGFTGKGDPNEEAGKVHKEEYVFEAPLVKGQESKFDALRNMLKSGVTLDQLFYNLSAKVNPIPQLMPAVVAQTNLMSPAYRSGGYDAASQNETRSLFAEVKSLLSDLKTKGIKADVKLQPTKVTEKLSGKNIYYSYELHKKEEKVV